MVVINRFLISLEILMTNLLMVLFCYYKFLHQDLEYESLKLLHLLFLLRFLLQILLLFLH